MAFVTLTKEIAEELASKAGNRDYKVTIESELVAYVQPMYDGCLIVEDGGSRLTFKYGDAACISVFKREPGW